VPFYAIADLAQICATTPDVIHEAAIIAGKRPIAGQLTFRPHVTLDFILEVRRVHAMHQRAEQRRERKGISK
jgi:hypothetical protein